MHNQRRHIPVFKPLPTGPMSGPGDRKPASFAPPPPYRLPVEDEPADQPPSYAEWPAETDAAPSPHAAAMDRLLHQSVHVDLAGRFMTPLRQEHDCRALEMSPGGVTLCTPAIAEVGSLIVAYLDHVGRIEGEVASTLEDGFRMTIKATPRRRDKLAAQLTYLANREALNLPEDRRHERVSLSATKTVLTLVNGTEIAIDILDASISGVAVATDMRPEVGTPGFIGAVRGRVVRHIEGGLAIEFAQVQDAELLEAALISGRPDL